ncbi:hypothetical protein BT67DRAFT_274351 [Trichocladium antarcticum]|uniref:Uncharacterized protein n=1 Tax=Trichocladium antarcticum TaxID=1450529 RepID=A0AAN6UMC5_9PEZI|nr:hypothetical protein BT67DRAFT_274351 [Trichocladium antarcticum]
MRELHRTLHILCDSSVSLHTYLHVPGSRQSFTGGAQLVSPQQNPRCPGASPAMYLNVERDILIVDRAGSSVVCISPAPGSRSLAPYR